jgi:hypothetical protein
VGNSDKFSTDGFSDGILSDLYVSNTFGCCSFGPAYTCHIIIEYGDSRWEEGILKLKVFDYIPELK